MSKVLSERDLRRVRDFLFSVQLKWYDIGIELDIPVRELNLIKRKYNDDPGDCLREMVIVWLQSFENPPTWKALTGALNARAVNERALATEGE